MLRLVAGLVVLPVVLLLIANSGYATPTAVACSVGPGFDPVAISDVIVGGRIASFERLLVSQGTGETVGDAKGASWFTPVVLDFEVQHVWKGQIGEDETIVDSNSLVVAEDPVSGDEQVMWRGASGSCGALDADPTGMFVVAGLSKEEDGSLGISRVTTFYLGSEPYDPAGVDAFGEALGPPLVTIDVDGDGSGSSSWLAAAIFVGCAALILAGVAMFFGNRRRKA
jgi:hypothetical protein